jgi:hypothetical protein
MAETPPYRGPSITELTATEIEILYQRHREMEGGESLESERVALLGLGAPSLPPLPIDDGRGAKEEWPWRRSDDHTPRIRWRRWVFHAFIVAGVGAALSLLLAAVVPLTLALALGAIVGLSGLIHEWLVPWPAWRVRNLEAANHRANQSLKVVDAEFGKEMRTDERMDPPVEPKPLPKWLENSAGRTCGDFNPHALGYGRRYSREDDDDLPF